MFIPYRVIGPGTAWAVYAITTQTIRVSSVLLMETIWRSAMLRRAVCTSTVSHTQRSPAIRLPEWIAIALDLVRRSSGGDDTTCLNNALT
jgi:hypothetical protein